MRQPVPFGKYLLLDRISVGGMAEVFKAKSYGVEGFEKIIAIKRILPTMGEDRDFIKMFIDEAKIAGQLAHANICQIFELGRIDGSHFIAMEYIWGKDLLQIQNRLRKLKQPMPVSMACFIIAKVLEGLDYAHRKRDPLGRPLEIVHRDCSPQNVLVSYEGEVKVIDFGIAKATSRNSRTMAGVLKGKFGYMSPEQVRGLPLDRRSDLFALGTMLYECLTSERLFQGETDFSTLEKVRNVDIRPPREVNPNIPEHVERVILKALAKDVDDRYQWCSEFLADIQQYLMSQDVVFTAKSLSTWLKDGFSPEIDRERQQLETYKRVGRDGLIQGVPAAEAKVDVVASLGEAGLPEGDATQLGEPNFDDIESLSAASPNIQLGKPGAPQPQYQAPKAPSMPAKGAMPAGKGVDPRSRKQTNNDDDNSDFGEEAPTEIFGELDNNHAAILAAAKPVGPLPAPSAPTPVPPLPQARATTSSPKMNQPQPPPRPPARLPTRNEPAGQLPIMPMTPVGQSARTPQPQMLGHAPTAPAPQLNVQPGYVASASLPSPASVAGSQQQPVYNQAQHTPPPEPVYNHGNGNAGASLNGNGNGNGYAQPDPYGQYAQPQQAQDPYAQAQQPQQDPYGESMAAGTPMSGLAHSPGNPNHTPPPQKTLFGTSAPQGLPQYNHRPTTQSGAAQVPPQQQYTTPQQGYVTPEGYAPQGYDPYTGQPFPVPQQQQPQYASQPQQGYGSQPQQAYDYGQQQQPQPGYDYGQQPHEQSQPQPAYQYAQPPQQPDVSQYPSLNQMQEYGGQLAPAPQPAVAVEQSPAEPRKKKSTLVRDIIIGVLIAAFVLGAFLLVKTFVLDAGDDSSATTESSSSIANVKLKLPAGVTVALYVDDKKEAEYTALTDGKTVTLSAGDRKIRLVSGATKCEKDEKLVGGDAVTEIDCPDLKPEGAAAAVGSGSAEAASGSGGAGGGGSGSSAGGGAGSDATIVASADKGSAGSASSDKGSASAGSGSGSAGAGSGSAGAVIASSGSNAASGSGSGSAAVAVVDPTKKPVDTKPVVDPTKKPLDTKPVVDPTKKPDTKPVVDPTKKPDKKPVTVDKMPAEDNGDKDKGFLAVTCRPTAKLLVDTVPTGLSTPARLPLTPGKHRITFAIGEDKYSFPVVIKAGETQSMTKDFQQP